MKTASIIEARSHGNETDVPGKQHPGSIRNKRGIVTANPAIPAPHARHEKFAAYPAPGYAAGPTSGETPSLPVLVGPFATGQDDTPGKARTYSDPTETVASLRRQNATLSPSLRPLPVPVDTKKAGKLQAFMKLHGDAVWSFLAGFGATAICMAVGIIDFSSWY